MALNNRNYAIELNYQVKGIDCKNVFWYETDDIVTAIQLWTAFESAVYSDILAIQSSDTIYKNAYIYNLVTLTDFTTIDLENDPGSRGGDCLPPFVGWYFRYVRTTRAIRDGRKTFSGVAETDVTDGSPTVTAQSLLDALSSSLQSAFTVAGFSTATPCIAQTIEYENPSTGKVYRVPHTFFNVNTVLFKNVSSQNSRKR